MISRCLLINWFRHELHLLTIIIDVLIPRLTRKKYSSAWYSWFFVYIKVEKISTVGLLGFILMVFYFNSSFNIKGFIFKLLKVRQLNFTKNLKQLLPLLLLLKFKRIITKLFLLTRAIFFCVLWLLSVVVDILKNWHKNINERNN